MKLRILKKRKSRQKYEDRIWIKRRKGWHDTHYQSILDAIISLTIEETEKFAINFMHPFTDILDKLNED